MKNLKPRGTSLIVVMSVGAILAFTVSSLFVYVSSERGRAIRQSRDVNRTGCAMSGLMLGRTYFASNKGLWNTTYLSNPGQFNPIVSAGQMGSTWNNAATAAQIGLTAQGFPQAGLIALKAAQPNLFYDLDGDGNADVYTYIRDNQDELPPAPNNWLLDNDLNVIIGAACISNTLVPRQADGTVVPGKQIAESLLSYNGQDSSYTGQANGGARGDGNLNNNM